MFERLSERARKVMVLANAATFQSKQSAISPEHLLIGLLEEGTGRGWGALQSLGVDLNKLKQQLTGAGAYQATQGNTPALPLSPSTNLTGALAVREARDLNQNYCGTEHILLAILKDGDSVAGSTLRNLGITGAQVREVLWAARGERPTGNWTP